MELTEGSIDVLGNVEGKLEGWMLVLGFDEALGCKEGSLDGSRLSLGWVDGKLDGTTDSDGL